MRLRADFPAAHNWIILFNRRFTITQIALCINHLCSGGVCGSLYDWSNTKSYLIDRRCCSSPFTICQYGGSVNHWRYHPIYRWACRSASFFNIVELLTLLTGCESGAKILYHLMVSSLTTYVAICAVGVGECSRSRRRRASRWRAAVPVRVIDRYWQSLSPDFIAGDCRLSVQR